jgi:peptide chain release factor subunit 3
VDRLLIETDVATKQKKKEPMFVKSNGMVTVKIDVEQSVSVQTYVTMPSLGQFTLRDEGRTIAIGRITRVLIKKKK